MYQASHPVHFAENGDFKVTSSLIPICGYKSDLTLSKPPSWLPNISFPVCSSFLPTILDGHLCYKIQVNATADQGRENELVMLLDYNEDRSLTPPVKKDTASNSTTITRLNFDHAKNQHEKAKIKIHTLSNYEGYGGGSYKMTAVKRMTSTNAFLNMPFKHRGCNVELFQECKTRRILEKCKCVPAEVQASVGRYPKEYMRCTPEGRD